MVWLSDLCPWCKYNPYGCVVEECDFKTLPYEKNAILKRLKKEKKKVDEMRAMIKDADIKKLEPEVFEKVQDVLDLLKGMQIMVDRLVADFGMTTDEVYNVVGFGNDKMSWLDKAKIGIKLAKLRRMRKKGVKKNKKR